MNQYTILTKKLVCKTIRQLAPTLRLLAKTIHKKGENLQQFVIEDFLGMEMKAAALDVLWEISPRQQTAANFGIVYAMDTNLRDFIYELALEDPDIGFIEYEAECQWLKELKHAQIASEYFPSEQEEFIKKSVVFSFLHRFILDAIKEYLMPDWESKAELIEQDFPDSFESYLPFTYSLENFFKGTDAEDWHPVTHDVQRTMQ